MSDSKTRAANGKGAAADQKESGQPLVAGSNDLNRTENRNGGKGVYNPANDDMSLSTADTGSTVTRDTWNNKIDFLLACVGFSVGLGNVWRFPYLCYTNGGGAFLIPYFTCVVLGGIPMFYLEVALGQFMQQGGIGAWKICPLLQGIGVATTVIVFLLNIYYNVILAWGLYYLYSSFTDVLPWSHCNNYWNTKHCVVNIHAIARNLTGTDNHHDANATAATAATATAAEAKVMNVTEALRAAVERGTHNTTDMAGSAVNITALLEKHTDPVTEFWERRVLQISSGIDEPGHLQWELALCLLLAWVIIYFCIWKGVKTSGKVMYFTATSPYVLMLVLLVRGVTLPGAVDGIKFYVIPEWSKLADPQVWVDAGTQIFFSYSISLGALTALGSYNKFHHNSYKDTILFACTNSVTSFLAGFVIFSVLGFMAQEQGVDVGHVAESGPGLAFIAYPKAVTQMPVSPLWSILFFIMILLLGLDSQFVGVEGFITAISDFIGPELRRGYRKETFIGVVCFISFLIGLSMVTQGGMYVFQIFDYYSGSRIILLVALFECIAMAWIYGVSRFYDDIERMLGFRIGPYMRISWKFTSPLFSLVMFGMCVYSYSELTYNRVYSYPKWAIVMGWTMACCSVTMIPVVAIYRLATAEGSLKQRLIDTIRPKLGVITTSSTEEMDEIAAAKQINNTTIVLTTSKGDGNISASSPLTGCVGGDKVVTSEGNGLPPV